MKDYETLVDAINDLKARGYTEDFNLEPNCLACPSLKLQIHPEKFTVDEYYRFEGMSDPNDSSVIYAISSENDLKGILVDAYGAYSENLSQDMIQKLSMNR